MKKISTAVVASTVIILFMFGCLLLVGCSKGKKQMTLQSLLEGYLTKEVAVSMWDSERSKPVLSTFIVAEVNPDYVVVTEQGEKVKKIAIPFSNISNIILSETPPVIVLNDQIMLTGFGETIDNLGYVGSRIERLRPSSKPVQQ
jgi:hypothetical protein